MKLAPKMLRFIHAQSFILPLLLLLAFAGGCLDAPTIPKDSNLTPVYIPEVEETIEEGESEETSTVTTGQLKAHFINVGQGDAILIQTPEQNNLIDGGDHGTTVVNYLQSQGIESLGKELLNLKGEFV